MFKASVIFAAVLICNELPRTQRRTNGRGIEWELCQPLLKNWTRIAITPLWLGRIPSSSAFGTAKAVEVCYQQQYGILTAAVEVAKGSA